VAVLGSTRDVVAIGGSWGISPFHDRPFAPVDCWALRRGRPNVLSDDSADVQCAHIGPERPGRALCVPMMAQTETLGLLYIESAAGAGIHHSSGWSANELQLARTLAEQAALALTNLLLREALRLESVRDPLTSLYNRRFLEDALGRELRRAVRQGTPMGVMMIDIDHFKRFNDTSAHDAGDAVLRAVADLLREQVRGEDVICRYGGEEFTMILPEASLETTRVRAEAVRAAAARLVIRWHGQTLASVTLSIGVSSCPDHGTTGELLLRAADTALYRAKVDGRNRVLAA
jgi:diguanylate cyclase (GGDEF)-like protein